MRAITMLQRALRMHRRTGIGLKLATTLNDLGVVLSRSGQHREAVEYLVESLENHQGDYHLIEFSHLGRFGVLDRLKAEEAHQEILERYGIGEDRNL